MPAVAFRRLEAEVLALYTPPHRRRSTWFKARKVLSEFRELPGLARTSDITPLAITQWLDAYAHRAPMTNRSYLSTFRAACNYARKMGYLRVTPWEIRRDWITFDGDEEDDVSPSTRHLSIAQIAALLAQVDSEALRGGWIERRMQALVYTFVHTGLRKQEALGLKIADLSAGVIRVRSRRKRKLKTRGSARLVGVPDDLSVVLDRWIPDVGSEWLFPGIRRAKPWFYGGPGKRPLDAIKSVAGRAGISDVTIQSLRRSLATHGKAFGLGQLEVKGLLGHTSTRTQEWYIEEDEANARSLAKRIRFRTEESQPFVSSN